MTLQAKQPQTGLHYIMGYIAACWPNFGSGKTPEQKRSMIAVWESQLADLPVGLQKEAIDREISAGHLDPPSSPAELRNWCGAIQQPMDSFSALFYRSALEEGALDADFCRRQLKKYADAKREGRNVYAGWD